jgi:hypothetical protein
MATNYGHGKIVTDGLVFAYDAADTNSYPGSGTTWYNLATKTSNGTLTNGPVYSSDNAGHISFDGANDIINGPSGVTWFTNTSFTIEGWIRPDTSPPSQQVWFAAVGPTGGGNKNMHLRIYSNGTLRFGYYADDLNSTSGAVTFGTWNHVVWSYDYSGDTSKIYSNGSEVGSGAQGPFNDTSATVYLGLWQVSQPFKGDIAVGKVYTKTLTPGEILQNYNAQKTRFGL